MDGSDGTRKDTEDTTIVQIEEVDRAIRELSFVTICGKKQESPVQVSSRHPTLHACLQELLK
jgi:hypothetical protein